MKYVKNVSDSEDFFIIFYISIQLDFMLSEKMTLTDGH